MKNTLLSSNKKLIVNRWIYSFIILCLSYPSISQNLVSIKQTEVEKLDTIFGNKLINLNKNSFYIELPNKSEFIGDMSLREENEDFTKFVEKTYDIRGGGVISVKRGKVFLNLYGTNYKTAYTYYLEGYTLPSKEEIIWLDKKTAESSYKSDVEIYGIITANCVRDGVVKIGLDASMVTYILGEPISRETIEGATKTGYADKFVYKSIIIITDLDKVINIINR